MQNLKQILDTNEQTIPFFVRLGTNMTLITLKKF
ncbi:hypothetical protein L1275_000358 [Flavobacterium sp. HSC-61S13]|nr:hypothetical protein [Flavobacterium sp. HSC-61S13]